MPEAWLHAATHGPPPIGDPRRRARQHAPAVLIRQPIPLQRPHERIHAHVCTGLPGTALSRPRRSLGSLSRPPRGRVVSQLQRRGVRAAPCPNCGRDVATLQTGRSVFGKRPAPAVPHNRGMPLQIHIQPDPDHFCETCGGPSELTSHSITRWHGNKMAREVSPPTPRCVDPSCQSRRPRHLRRETRASAHHCEPFRV